MDPQILMMLALLAQSPACQVAQFGASTGDSVVSILICPVEHPKSIDPFAIPDAPPAPSEPTTPKQKGKTPPTTPKHSDWNYVER